MCQALCEVLIYKLSNSSLWMSELLWFISFHNQGVHGLWGVLTYNIFIDCHSALRGPQMTFCSSGNWASGTCLVSEWLAEPGFKSWSSDSILLQFYWERGGVYSLNSFCVPSAEKRIYCSLSQSSFRRVLLSHFSGIEIEAQRGEAIGIKPHK